MLGALRLFTTCLIALCCLCGAGRAGAENATNPAPVRAPFTVLEFAITGTINPAQADALNDAIHHAQTSGADLLLLRIDTPGGLGSSMREMAQSILGAPIPVAVWVGPGGARAASAGVFLVAASHIAGMSPQATIGAASPVNISGKSVNGTMGQKVTNDIMSLVRAMAHSRERNVEWYEKAVEESDSITGTEAVNLGVVEILASSENDFLRAIAKEGIPFRGGTITFDPARMERVAFEPGARHTILSWLLSPQVAYLLLLGGMAGLFFELATPGAVFPGVFGGLCLLLALYALSILPTTAAGVLLILFAMLLFILEVFVTSYGLLAISGLAALFFGSTILFRFEYGFTALPMGIIASTVVGVGCIVFLGVYLVAKAQTIPVRLGPQTLVGKTAVVRTWQNGKGQVLVRGEIWTAEHPEGLAMVEGDTVRVVRTEGLRLIVEKEKGAPV